MLRRRADLLTGIVHDFLDSVETQFLELAHNDFEGIARGKALRSELIVTVVDVPVAQHSFIEKAVFQKKEIHFVRHKFSKNVDLAVRRKGLLRRTLLTTLFTW